MRHFALHLIVAGSLAVFWAGQAHAQWPFQAPTQAQEPPAATSRGENFSAGKSPAQLFASDCTGSGCHKSAQGLSKDRSRIGLAGFLREHYTNSRETAAALAAYLVSVPAETRAARPERPRAAARSEDGAKPAEAAKPAVKPARGRQAAAPPPPPPPPDPEPVAAAPEPPPAPPKPQWDIFD